MKRINNLSKEFFFVFFIAGLFFVEFLFTLYTSYVGDNYVRYVGLYKLLFELFLIISIPFNKRPKIIFYGLLVIITTYIINQIVNPIFFDDIFHNFSKGSFYFLNRFLYVFIFILAFLGIKNKIEVAKVSVKIIEHILFINIFFMIFGVISNIEFFTSYPQSPLRFGSDGLFNKVNEVSYLYIIYILALYYRHIKKGEVIWKFIFVSLASLLLGTKTVILFLGLLFLFHFLFVSKYKKKFLIFVLPCFFVSVYYFKDIVSFIFNLSPFWSNLLNKYSLFSLVFSTRDLLVISNYHYVLENWSFINYLIGGPFYTESFTRTRMDIVDLLLHFGLISTIIYLFIIFKYFFYKNKNILNALSALLIFCGFLGGGLFLRVSAIVYMFLAFYVLNNQEAEISSKSLVN